MSNGLDPETLQMTLDAIGEFAGAHLTEEKLLELDAKDEFPEDLVREMCGGGLGIQLLFIPEEFGGMGGGTFDIYRLCERMARIDLGVATGVLATFLGSDPITVGGTDDQKREWLTRLAEEGLLMAYAATEPEAGSDLANLKTVATPVHENGELTGYRITGNKQWISNGGFADLYTVLAQAPAGASWFLVEKGAKGLSHGKPEDKHGIRISNTASVSLEDVLVPADQLLGGSEGRGLRQAQQVFGYTRLMVAAFGLGAGWEAVDRAIHYSTERVQAKSPLSEKQGYTHKLIVPHVARLEAARAYIEQTAERIDAGEGSLNAEGAIAKYLATEFGNTAAEAAIQAFGGYGYTREYVVEKIKRDVRITTIYEGTSEIMEMTIARDRWKKHLRTKGGLFRDQASELDTIHAANVNVGGDIAACACRALGRVLDACQKEKLTRSQHVLLRLGELIAWTEGAVSLVLRANRAADELLDAKADRRFGPEDLSAISRIFGREAVSKVAGEGLRLVLGSSDDPEARDGLEGAFDLAETWRTQTGLLADMDWVADALYGRS